LANTLSPRYTASTLSNNWTSAGVAIVTLASGDSKVVADEAVTAFQPLFNTKGTMLAYTAVDSDGYTWAQTWHICIHVVATSTTQCTRSGNGTVDQMPTLVGWHGDQLLYMEQVGLAVNLFSFAVDAQRGAPLDWSRVSIDFPPPYAKGAVGVIGGGFRATSRVTVVAESGGSSTGKTLLGLTYEQPTVSQQAFVVAMSPSTAEPAVAKKISDINAGSATHAFAESKAVTWTSDDGMEIEGILMLPAGFSKAQLAAAPAVVFTHCGPAMAVLATFHGYGSVCARFPLETLAESGYVVLQPNYRGSTG
jgi:dipeptidyl aminopeptidase/acylaminoacyl peptidase